MKAPLTVAVAQCLCNPGDISSNLARMEPMVKRAAGEGAGLVLFSEMGVTGYLVGVPAVTKNDSTWKSLEEMAGDHRIAIAAGFLEADAGDRYISHATFLPDGNVALQRKARAARVETAIPGFRTGHESRSVVTIGGWRIATVICAEFGIAGIRDSLRILGIDLVLAPTAGGGRREIGFSRDSLNDPATFDRYLAAAESVCFPRAAIADCRRHQTALATCNHLADNGIDYFHPGHSMVIDADGRLAALIPGCFVFEHIQPTALVAATLV